MPPASSSLALIPVPAPPPMIGRPWATLARKRARISCRSNTGMQSPLLSVYFNNPYILINCHLSLRLSRLCGAYFLHHRGTKDAEEASSRIPLHQSDQPCRGRLGKLRVVDMVVELLDGNSRTLLPDRVK